MNFEKVIADLIEKKWSLNENFLSSKKCSELINEFSLFKLNQAKIGQGANRLINSEIRSDFIHWIDQSNATKLQNEYISYACELQNIVNRELYLGLKEIEVHLAHYPAGSHYAKHTDQFKGNNSRTLTLITYLNTPTEGGELIIYNRENNNEIDQIIKPQTGMMITFLSDQLYHEVKMTKSDRYSITGWFKNEISI
jgi:SM-20-related protein